MERNNHYEGGYTDHVAKQNTIDDLSFARTIAFDLIAHGIILDDKLCARFIRESFFSARDMDLIRKAYEEYDGQE